MTPDQKTWFLFGLLLVLSWVFSQSREERVWEARRKNQKSKQ